MKIKTFIAGRTNGDAEAFRILDDLVAKDLGSSVVIHSVKDGLYGDMNSKPGDFIMTRVIVYSYPDIP